MTEYKEVHARQILNPTAIDLAEYVINPYRGCAMSCLYCYARFMKTSLRENRPWGEYVYVKINAPKVLEREIARKKPHCVLLGSTTECFQEIEKKYNLARRILEVLHKHRICYYILTRSPYIAESAALLREDLCKGVYFTVNLYHASLKEKLEPRSAPFDERLACVKALRAQGVRVIPYVSPFLPWICDVDALCARLDVFEAIEFEGLNFRLGNIDALITSIAEEFPSLGDKYRAMRDEAWYYNDVWRQARKALADKAAAHKKRYEIFVHAYNAYFENTYTTR
jgi:DNA repair photolyase